MALGDITATYASERNVAAEAGDGKAEHGSSIMKEMFADPPKQTPRAPGKVSLQLLNSLPSPARTCAKNVPCGPPAHPPAPLAAPTLPPPPDFLPAQERPRAMQAVAPALSEPTCGSYIERLRAGGRGALQRGVRGGMMPKNRNQEWIAGMVPSAPATGFLSQQPGGQHGPAMSNGTQRDGQQTWSETVKWLGTGHMQSNEGWNFNMNQSQVPQQQQQQPYMQHAPQLQQQGVINPMQMMQMAQMQAQQLQLPQMAMSQGQDHTPTASGASTPVDFDRCVAMFMPQVGQFGCDKDMMAAQLQAAADCQCYED